MQANHWNRWILQPVVHSQDSLSFCLIKITNSLLNFSLQWNHKGHCQILINISHYINNITTMSTTWLGRGTTIITWLKFTHKTIKSAQSVVQHAYKILHNISATIKYIRLSYTLKNTLVFHKQCCCPRGSSRTNFQVLPRPCPWSSSPCPCHCPRTTSPCPCPRKFKSSKIFEDWVGYLCQHFVLG